MPTGNRLLDHLPPSLCLEIVNASVEVDLPSRAPLFNSDQPVGAIHFLTAGVASLVITMAEGGSAEVGMIGAEGAVGTPGLLGRAVMEAECFMQIAGRGFRLPIAVARRLFEDSTEFRGALLEFLQTQINISAQLSACNKLHEAEARLARWLLVAADRAHSETLLLTQEFLAQMLGSQRTTVALVAGILQRSGYIDYSRGTVRIVDRPGLMSAACECYQVTRTALDGVYRPREAQA